MEGIIVRAYPSGNYDLILYIIFKEFGKLSCFASNARRLKRNSSFPELFDHCRFEIVPGQGDLQKIKQFRQITAFPGLRTDLLKFSTASIVCESADILIPEAEELHSEENFQIIKDCLTELNTKLEQNLILKNCYQTLYSLLKNTGLIAPEEAPPATRNNLVKLLNKVEHIAERELKSKESLIEFLKTL